MIQSSSWLTQQMDDIINEMQILPDDCDIAYQEDLLDRMDHLQRKADWENRENIRFNEKYKDML